MAGEIGKQVTDTADQIFAIGKAVISSGIVATALVWVFKKLSTYLTVHHSNVTKHNSDRSTEIAKKEDALLTETANERAALTAANVSERMQIFTILKEMLVEQGKQNASVMQHTNAVTEVTKLIGRHIEAMEGHTKLVVHISELLQLEKRDLLKDLNNSMENGFEKYVNVLQEHPEIARKILSERNNPVDAVLSVTMQSVVDLAGPGPAPPNAPV